MPGVRSKRKRAETADAPARRRGSLGTEPSSSQNLKNTRNKNNEGEGKAVLSQSSNKAASLSGQTDKEITKDNRSARLEKTSEKLGQKEVSSQEKSEIPDPSNESGDDKGGDHALGDNKAEASLPQQEGQGTDEMDGRTSRASRTSTQSAAAAGTAQQSPPTAAELAPERVDQLRAFLMHRKVLLKRVRQGKAAVQKRLDHLDKTTPTTKTSDEEVIAFRERLRKATSLARKQKTEGSTEKRASVSLRRGSSVGKRMNAALSSLAPGHAGAMADSATSTSPVPAAASSTGLPTTASQRTTATVTSSALQPTAPATASGTTARKQLVTKKSDRRASSVPLRPSKSQKVVAAPNPFAAATRGMPVAAVPGSKIPLHSGLKPAPGINRMQQQQLHAPPSVICPEAVALRERRKVASSKLTALLERRLQKAGTLPSRVAESSMGRSPPRKGSTTRIPTQTRRAFLRGPEPPPHLPRRRKTNWDYLLQEMRWLATDFMEERKWKVATSRAMAHYVVTRDSPEQPEDAVKGATGGATERTDGEEATSLDTDKVSVDEDSKCNRTKRQRSSLSDSGHNRMYADTTSDESEQALSVAKRVSSIYAEEVPLLLKSRRLEETTRTLPSDAEAAVSAVEMDESPSPADKKTSDQEPSNKPATSVRVTRNERKALLEKITSLVDGVAEKAGKNEPKSRRVSRNAKDSWYRSQC